jgi:hypothetical protein
LMTERNSSRGSIQDRKLIKHAKESLISRRSS